MSHNFHVGQKVVCIKDGNLSHINAGPTVYTVAWVGIPIGCPNVHLILSEIKTGGEHADRFRPVVTRPTSIEIFKRMLNPSKQEEVA